MKSRSFLLRRNSGLGSVTAVALVAATIPVSPTAAAARPARARRIGVLPGIVGIRRRRSPLATFGSVT